jgi:DNA-binding NarL/FixJ family response regulator
VPHSAVIPFPNRRSRQHLRVLVADDCPRFAELLEAILATEDWIELVGRAPNGRKAVSLTASLAPDVVLMDRDMPELDGLEATRLIRAASPGTAVVMVTGSSAAESAQLSFAAGAAGFVEKHRAPLELVETIAEVTPAQRSRGFRMRDAASA